RQVHAPQRLDVARRHRVALGQSRHADPRPLGLPVRRCRRAIGCLHQMPPSSARLGSTHWLVPPPCPVITRSPGCRPATISVRSPSLRPVCTGTRNGLPLRSTSTLALSPPCAAT